MTRRSIIVINHRIVSILRDPAAIGVRDRETMGNINSRQRSDAPEPVPQILPVQRLRASAAETAQSRFMMPNWSVNEAE